MLLQVVLAVPLEHPLVVWVRLVAVWLVVVVGLLLRERGKVRPKTFPHLDYVAVALPVLVASLVPVGLYDVVEKDAPVLVLPHQA